MISRSEIKARIEQANQDAVRRVCDSQTTWTGVGQALDAIPGMTKSTILHAGPPISYQDMCGPQQNAVRGALIYEGMAKNMDEAGELARSGDITLAPCHKHRTVGSMCGITSASMPVNIVRNETFGNEAYCTVYESPEPRNLVFGYFDKNVLEQLKWVEGTLYPAMDHAIKRLGGIDTKRIIARALTMGDECHNRHWAATATLALELFPALMDGDFDRKKAKQVAEFIARSDHFFLHLTMPTCKAMADAANGIEYSTVVTAIARNGVETGVHVSSLGSQWFTGPAGVIEGLFLSGFGPKDACLDLGDSSITETVGLGSAAMAAAPAMQMEGAVLENALWTTRQMENITIGHNPHFLLPALDWTGTPIGIDIRLVLQKNIVPTINTGIAHNDALGQVGAGTTEAPIEAFKEALRAFGEKYN